MELYIRCYLLNNHGDTLDLSRVFAYSSPGFLTSVRVLTIMSSIVILSPCLSRVRIRVSKYAKFHFPRMNITHMPSYICASEQSNFETSSSLFRHIKLSHFQIVTTDVKNWFLLISCLTNARTYLSIA